ncbi:MAG: class I SAM-dependent methyltransferase [Pseudomonadota bacterium]
MSRVGGLTPILLACFSALALAQAPKPPAYEPSLGQDGKDVVWVPTPQATADKMLDLARVGPKDFVIDLGSGDGRLVIGAAKRGARALGVEYNPELVELSRRNAEREGVADRAKFEKADLFETDFSQASVITMFLLTSINLQLRPKLLALKPGTRIVSNTFGMGDWAPDESAELGLDACNESWCSALLWIVPARVAGTWRVPQGELKLEQDFQNLSGTLTAGGITVALREGKVRGEEIRFTANGRPYRGRLKGGKLELR